MNSIIWKAFTLGNLFNRSTKLAMGTNQKDLNLTDEKDDSHTIALISASRNGSGRVGYVETDLIDKSKVSINKLTFDDQWGFTFFQQEDFVITGGHNAILEIVDEKFKNLLDKNLSCYSFLSLIINNITIKTGIYGYGYKINNKLDREIILLPCLEVAEGEDYIWEENGKHYTLAVDYIKKLMDEAKELREEKTIRLYEAERAKYEAEYQKKYEAEYQKERNNIIWKAYRLGDIFERSTKLAMGTNQKDLNLAKEKDNNHTVALISASRNGSGRVGYVETSLVDESKISINKLTFDDQWGFTFFQQEDFVITGGHNAILEIRNEHLKEILDNNLQCYSFLSLIINNITIKTGIYGYGYKINNKLDREIILLPCLEVAEGEDYIWEEDGKQYTLAANYISYLYLTGRVNYNQKLIDNYTYQY